MNPNPRTLAAAEQARNVAVQMMAELLLSGLH